MHFSIMPKSKLGRRPHPTGRRPSRPVEARLCSGNSLCPFSDRVSTPRFVTYFWGAPAIKRGNRALFGRPDGSVALCGPESVVEDAGPSQISDKQSDRTVGVGPVPSHLEFVPETRPYPATWVTSRPHSFEHLSQISRRRGEDVLPDPAIRRGRLLARAKSCTDVQPPPILFPHPPLCPSSTVRWHPSPLTPKGRR